MKKTTFACTLLISGVLMLIAMSILGGHAYIMGMESPVLDFIWTLSSIVMILFGILVNITSMKEK